MRCPQPRRGRGRLAGGRGLASLTRLAAMMVAVLGASPTQCLGAVRAACDLGFAPRPPPARQAPPAPPRLLVLGSPSRFVGVGGARAGAPSRRASRG